MLKPLIASILLLFTSLLCSAQWTSSETPKEINLANIQFIDSLFYVPTVDGVFIRKEGAPSWSQLSAVTNIEKIVKHGSYLFAFRDYEGVLRSSNGVEWVTTNLVVNDLYDIVSYQNALYTTFSDVLKSEDDGVTWNAINDNLNLNVFQLLKDTLYGAGYGGLYYYNPDSAQFLILTDSASCKHLFSSGNHFLAQSNYSTISPKPVTKIWNTGSYWKVDTLAHVPDAINDYLSIDDQSGWLFGNNGIYLYQNDTVIPYPSNLDKHHLIKVAKGTNEKVVGTTFSLFNTNEDLSNWQLITDGFPNDEPNDLYVHNGIFYLATDNIAYKSAVSFTDWFPLPQFNPSLNAFDDITGISALNEDVFFLLENGLFRYNTLSHDMVKTSFTGQLTDLVNHNQILIASTYSDGKIYRSIDSGYTWNPSNIGLDTDEYIRSLLNSDSVVFAIGNSLYLSRDQGENWEKLFNGFIPSFSADSVGNYLLFKNGISKLTPQGDTVEIIREGYGYDSFLNEVLQVGNGFINSTYEEKIYYSPQGKDWFIPNLGLDSIFGALKLYYHQDTIIGLARDGIFIRPLAEIENFAKIEPTISGFTNSSDGFYAQIRGNAEVNTYRLFVSNYFAPNDEFWDFINVFPFLPDTSFFYSMEDPPRTARYFIEQGYDPGFISDTLEISVYEPVDELTISDIADSSFVATWTGKEGHISYEIILYENADSIKGIGYYASIPVQNTSVLVDSVAPETTYSLAILAFTEYGTTDTAYFEDIVTTLPIPAYKLLPVTPSQEWNIYPNPSYGTVSVLHPFTGPVLVTIYNPEGKMYAQYREENTQKLEVSLPGQRGIYLIEISSGEEHFLSRVVRF